MSDVCICPLQLDETLMERLWGLTEMFPDTVRTAAEVSAQCSVSLAKKFYRYTICIIIAAIYTVCNGVPVDQEINY